MDYDRAGDESVKENHLTSITKCFLFFWFRSAHPIRSVLF